MNSNIGTHTTHFKKVVSLSPGANRPSLFCCNCDCDIVTKVVAFADVYQLDASMADPDKFQHPHQIQKSMVQTFSSFVMNWFELKIFLFLIITGFRVIPVDLLVFVDALEPDAHASNRNY